MPAPSLQDLDRCPHGRHRGDQCAGHRGPGIFDHGCHGGFSLGNPYPYRIGDTASDRIGTTVHGAPILTSDIPADGRPAWVRARFHASQADYRPVQWPPPGPYWCSGESMDTGPDGYSIVVAWIREGDELIEWWPEASHIERDTYPEIVFASRFPAPAWWIGEGL